MGEYLIDCVIHDRFGIITHVGIQGQAYEVIQVVNWDLNKEHSFFTNKNGFSAKVHARKNQRSGRWFLTTEPDSIMENNLDFLPACVIR